MKMALNWDPVALLNVVFCIIILIMGVWGYKKTAKISLYIGIAFLFFAISHILTILGLSADLTYILLATRIIGYLIIIYALYKYLNP